MYTKWFGRSRALWAAAIPLLVALLPMFGVAPDGLQDQLVGFGDQAELTIQSVLLLGAAGLGIWAKLRPDNTPNTLLPKPNPGPAEVALAAKNEAYNAEVSARKAASMAGKARGMAEDTVGAERSAASIAAKAAENAAGAADRSATEAKASAAKAEKGTRGGA
jgi:hypothetical protein